MEREREFVQLHTRISALEELLLHLSSSSTGSTGAAATTTTTINTTASSCTGPADGARADAETTFHSELTPPRLSEVLRDRERWEGAAAHRNENTDLGTSLNDPETPNANLMSISPLDLADEHPPFRFEPSLGLLIASDGRSAERTRFAPGECRFAYAGWLALVDKYQRFCVRVVRNTSHCTLGIGLAPYGLDHTGFGTGIHLHPRAYMLVTRDTAVFAGGQCRLKRPAPVRETAVVGVVLHAGGCLLHFEVDGQMVEEPLELEPRVKEQRRAGYSVLELRPVVDVRDERDAVFIV